MSNKIYHVRPRDTLFDIARHCGIELPKLIALNPQIKNPDKIMPGQAIVVPGDISRRDIIVKSAMEIGGDEPLRLKIARREMAVVQHDDNAKKAEDRENPIIVEYLASVKGLSPGQVSSDETAWCSAFANWCCELAEEEGTDSAWALHWKNWGRDTDEPKPGDLVVWSRDHVTDPKDRGGHVGFFLYFHEGGVRVLGGNQSDSVCEQTYPFDGVQGKYRYKLVAYRTA